MVLFTLHIREWSPTSSATGREGEDAVAQFDRKILRSNSGQTREQKLFAWLSCLQDEYTCISFGGVPLLEKSVVFTISKLLLPSSLCIQVIF